VECREAREHFPACVDQPAGLPAGPAGRAVEAHLHSCAACQAELAAYRRLGSALAALPDHPVEPPAWLLGSVLDAVRAERRRHRLPAIPHAPEALSDPRFAAAGGAVLLAGLAAGAVLLRGRHRRRNGSGRLQTATAGA
jgi:anti-sigma factor RsiW